MVEGASMPWKSRAGVSVALDSAWLQASLDAQTRRRGLWAQCWNVSFVFDFLRFWGFGKARMERCRCWAVCASCWSSTENP